jgi:trans-aconitate methyltransferase
VDDGFDADNVASSYDAMAPQYAELFADELARNPSDLELLERFVASLRGDGPVCDLGCGPGHVASYLTARGLDAVGIDLSPGMVATARRLHPDAAFEQGDLRSLAGGVRRWAGVVAYYSLIFLRRHELADALAGIRSALFPGGVLAAIVHEGTGEIHTDEWRGEAVNVSATHFSVEEMKRALSGAGFDIELLRTRPPYEWEYQHDRVQVLARRP